ISVLSLSNHCEKKMLSSIVEFFTAHDALCALAVLFVGTFVLWVPRPLPCLVPVPFFIEFHVLSFLFNFVSFGASITAHLQRHLLLSSFPSPARPLNKFPFFAASLISSFLSFI